MLAVLDGPTAQLVLVLGNRQNLAHLHAHAHDCLPDTRSWNRARTYSSLCSSPFSDRDTGLPRISQPDGGRVGLRPNRSCKDAKLEVRLGAPLLPIMMNERSLSQYDWPLRLTVYLRSVCLRVRC